MEPDICLSQTSINFKRVFVGRGQKEKLELINNESLPFDFAFDRATYDATEEFLQGTGKGPSVRFDPDQGTLRPNSRFPITVMYKPQAEMAVNYTAVCNVKHKPTALTINVKGEGYAVHEELYLEAADGSEMPLSAMV
jgi:hydrocephalus-inducing protein